VYAAVSSTLEKIFQLRIKGAETKEKNAPPGKPEDLVRNLLVVGPSSAIANLDRRTDVQVRDLYQMLSAPMHKLLGTAKYLIIPRSRTHLGLEFGLTIGRQELKITARLLGNKQVIYR
jgi:hypothetical protein